MTKNVAKGNATVGVQTGGSKGVKSYTDDRGHKVTETKLGKGVTHVATEVRRNPGHPAGPGITTIEHHEHKR